MKINLKKFEAKAGYTVYFTELFGVKIHISQKLEAFLRQNKTWGETIELPENVYLTAIVKEKNEKRFTDFYFTIRDGSAAIDSPF